MMKPSKEVIRNRQDIVQGWHPRKSGCRLEGARMFLQTGTIGRAGLLKEKITGRARLPQRGHRGQRPLPLPSAGLGVQHKQTSGHRSCFGNPIDGRSANDGPRARVVHTNQGKNELHNALSNRPCKSCVLSEKHGSIANGQITLSASRASEKSYP